MQIAMARRSLLRTQDLALKISSADGGKKVNRAKISIVIVKSNSIIITSWEIKLPKMKEKSIARNVIKITIRGNGSGNPFAN